MSKALTDDEDNPFKKIELNKFNTRWGMVYNRDLVKFVKGNTGNVP